MLQSKSGSTAWNGYQPSFSATKKGFQLFEKCCFKKNCHCFLFKAQVALQQKPDTDKNALSKRIQLSTQIKWLTLTQRKIPHKNKTLSR